MVGDRLRGSAGGHLANLGFRFPDWPEDAPVCARVSKILTCRSAGERWSQCPETLFPDALSGSPRFLCALSIVNKRTTNDFSTSLSSYPGSFFKSLFCFYWESEKHPQQGLVILQSSSLRPPACQHLDTHTRLLGFQANPEIQTCGQS